MRQAEDDLGGFGVGAQFPGWRMTSWDSLVRGFLNVSVLDLVGRGERWWFCCWCM